MENNKIMDNRKVMEWTKIDRDENGRITDDCYYAMLDSLDEYPCFVVSADLNYCDYLIVTQLTNINEWYDPTRENRQVAVEYNLQWQKI